MSAPKQGMNQDSILQSNRMLILNLLRKHKISTRTLLAKETGLKQATITNIVQDLLDRNLVVERGMIKNERGRHAIAIALHSSYYKMIHVRLSRRYIMVGLFDLGGTLYSHYEEVFDTTKNPDKSLTLMRAFIAEILKEFAGDIIIGIGVALPGPFLKQKGKIGFTSEFVGWDHIALDQVLYEVFQIPTYLEHDANAGALAEWWNLPQNAGCHSMVYVAAGQGIGAGIIFNGQLLQGAAGTAGEIGHTTVCVDGPFCKCGNQGCLELYASTAALIKRAKEKAAVCKDTLLSGDITPASFFIALDQEDSVALEVFSETASYLAVGVINIINTYNPDIVVIGDEWAGAGERLLAFLYHKIKERLLPEVFASCTIVISQFQTDSAFIGAGMPVLEDLYALVEQQINKKE